MRGNAVIVAVTSVVLIALCYAMVNFNRFSKLSKVWTDKANRALQTAVDVRTEMNAATTGCPSPLGLIPPLDAIDGSSDEALFEAYRDFGSNAEVTCYVMRRMGNIGDGGWEVCNDELVRPPRNNCLVYSFGINNDFSFDNDVEKLYGCEVHAFDPSMKQGDHKHSEKVMFHHLGLYGTNGFIKNKWPVKTLAEIKKLLGHSQRRIDVIKMDIEKSEWPAMETALVEGSLKNVTQFLLELHNRDYTRDSLIPKLKTLQGLRHLGFRTFYAHKNPVCVVRSKTEVPKRSGCLELQMMYIPACDKTK